MGIKHSDVKASGEKGLAAEWNKNHVIDGNVDIEQNSWENQVIENVAAFPAGAIEGQMVWRSDLNKLYIYDGANWKDYAESGDVAIPTGTYYWSIPGTGFLPGREFNVYLRNTAGSLECGEDENDIFLAPVSLPNGATVTKVIVYGSESDETWGLVRTNLNAETGAAMATANVNTEDTTITNPTIDNSTYDYHFWTQYWNLNEKIYGARITYTL